MMITLYNVPYRVILIYLFILMVDYIMRNFYACQCFFKLGLAGIKYPGKTVFVFKTIQDRDSFLEKNKDEMQFFKVTQKEAFRITGLLKKDSIPCVYEHGQFTAFVLANIRSCYGSVYELLREYNGKTAKNNLLC